MPRVRLLYSKRGPFCFIRHVELPQVFSRSARRAHISMEKTQGFSPHPKITLGPALPVGVAALEEPAEIWFSTWEEGFLGELNKFTPPGLSVSASQVVEGLALNKLSQAAEYFIKPLDSAVLCEITGLLSEKLILKDLVLRWESLDLGVKIVLSDPLQVSPGKIISDLVEKKAIKGWSDLRMARLRIGLWDDRSKAVTPLLPDPLSKLKEDRP